MRSPHVPLIHDGSDDRAVRHEQLHWIMTHGYSAQASSDRRLILHDLAVRCAALFKLLGPDPGQALEREKGIREELESL